MYFDALHVINFLPLDIGTLDLLEATLGAEECDELAIDCGSDVLRGLSRYPTGGREFNRKALVDAMGDKEEGPDTVDWSANHLALIADEGRVSGGEINRGRGEINRGTCFRLFIGSDLRLRQIFQKYGRFLRCNILKSSTVNTAWGWEFTQNRVQTRGKRIAFAPPRNMQFRSPCSSRGYRVAASSRSGRGSLLREGKGGEGCLFSWPLHNP
jgi:hypothetical protein